MLEIYLSKLILYCILALAFGFMIGWMTLVQDIPKGKTFNLLYVFKSLKLTSIFEWIFSLFAKILKALTGINIDPEIKK
ncbi:MAG: hypothetical protein QG630_543 [Patescibacteria group bacterium]|nr:hypothetical protein [Patescibacteria group bacterium]